MMHGTDSGQGDKNWPGAAGGLKRRAREVVDVACAGTGLLGWSERRMRRGLTILMYHRVLPRRDCLGYPLESLVIPVDVFEQQMALLADRFRVLPVRDAIERLEHGVAGDRPMVAVTFDDGYADNHEQAAPVLARYGLRATFFVTTGFVASAAPTWFDRAADIWTRLDEPRRVRLWAQLDARLRSSENGDGAFVAQAGAPGVRAWMAGLKRLGVSERDALVRDAESLADAAPDPARYAPMSPAQVAELHREGHEVASHSVTHPILTKVSDTQLRDELTESREQLADWIGAPVPGLCYPNGDCDPRVIEAARAAGYRYACATSSGLNLPGVNPLALHRRSITMHRTTDTNGAHSTLGFRGEVSGLRDWWR